MKKENIALIVVSIVLVGIFVYSLFFSTPTYTVTFNTDGGSKVESVRVKRNNKVNKPVDPTKEGYKFVYWMVNDSEYNFEEPITSDTTITAKWEESKEDKKDDKSTTKTTKKTTKKAAKKK